MKRYEDMLGNDVPKTPAVRQAIRVLVAAVKSIDPSHEPRAAQIKMCAHIVSAIEDGADIAIKAGTGVGKSIAYAVPAALSGKRILVACATKPLQDQLLDGPDPDLSRAATAVQADAHTTVKASILKGRGNYLCLPSLYHQITIQGDTPSTTQAQNDVAQLSRLLSWAENEGAQYAGDLDHFQHPLSNDLRQTVSAEMCQCLRSEDETSYTCYYKRARETAEDDNTKIVVVNHSLLARLLTSNPRLVGDFQCILIDEAHRFAEELESSTGVQLRKSDVEGLLKQAELLGINDEATSIIQRCLDDVWRILAEYTDSSEYAIAIELSETQRGDRELQKALQQLSFSIDRLRSEPSLAAQNLESIGRLASQIDFLCQVLQAILTQRNSRGTAAVVSCFNENNVAVLQTQSIDVTDVMRLHLADTVQLVLCSATLDRAAARELRQRQTWRHVVLPSPYEYHKQAMLYIPHDMADPRENESEFEADAQLEIVRLVDAIRGRSLILVNSKTRLDRFHALLRREAGRLGVRVYKQDEDGSVADLKRRLREDHSTVVFGTRKFYQGVDVPGPDLQLVILLRLPFDSRETPLWKAKDASNRLPRKAVDGQYYSRMRRLTVQGAGRLIRRETDRGMVAILDPRMHTQREKYGKQLLGELPPMQQTADPQQAVSFLKGL